MNLTTVRLHYTQIFMIGLLGVSLYIMSRSLGGGISQFENHLLGHKFLVSSFTEIRLKLGDRVFLQALVGKEGWLEFRKELDSYHHAAGSLPKTLGTTQQNIQKLYEELRKRNITLIVVISPNKATIYPDKLPDEIRIPSSQSNLDAFTAYMQQHGPPVVVDLRQALLDGRKEHDLYFKTDTHWNAYGAFIAYTQIMKQLSKTYPQLTPKSINDFKIATSQPYPHDIAQIMGATSLVETTIVFKPKKDIDANRVVLNEDTITPLQTYTTPQKNSPTLLMYMDSYGYGMKDFIFPHFSKATFIQTNSKYPDTLSPKTINAIEPDIVIVEVVERFFNVQLLDTIVNRLLSTQK